MLFRFTATIVVLTAATLLTLNQSEAFKIQQHDDFQEEEELQTAAKLKSSETNDNGWSGGEIAGISVGILALAIIFVVVLCCCCGCETITNMICCCLVFECCCDG